VLTSYKKPLTHSQPLWWLFKGIMFPEASFWTMQDIFELSKSMVEMNLTGNHTHHSISFTCVPNFLSVGGWWSSVRLGGIYANL
jgi:hypothetical protein